MSVVTKPPALFWVISGIATLWNLLMVASYIFITRATPEVLAENSTQGFADIMATRPAWATGAFAIFAFAGLAGCIGLLLRKSWAKIAFILSLVSIIIYDIWGVMAGTFQHIGTADKVMTVATLLISVFLIWFAHKKTAKGYLN